MKKKIGLACSTLILSSLLGACHTTTPTPHVDTRIKLMPSADGKKMIALPPECGQWQDQLGDPWQNNPWPNFGCATARNLAVAVETPEDLITPHQLGEADGVTTASAVDRYRAGKTKPLIDAKAESPVTVMMPTTAASPK